MATLLGAQIGASVKGAFAEVMTMCFRGSRDPEDMASPVKVKFNAPVHSRREELAALELQRQSSLQVLDTLGYNPFLS